MFIPIWYIEVISIVLFLIFIVIIGKFINEFMKKRIERKAEKAALLEEYTQAALEGKVLTSGIHNHFHAYRAVEDKDLGTFTLPRKTDAEYALIDGHIFKITFLREETVYSIWVGGKPEKAYTYLIYKETL